MDKKDAFEELSVLFDGNNDIKIFEEYAEEMLGYLKENN